MTSNLELFAPQHVVVVGASEDPNNIGGRFVRALRRARFSGDVSIIHPSGEEVAGYPGYRDFRSLPKPADHVIIAVAGERVTSIVASAVDAKSRLIHVFAGGYSERGEEGDVAQAELVRTIQGSDSRLIGPNCMGLHHPGAGITFREDLPIEAGPFGIVSQSGGIAIASIRLAALRRVGVSTAISYGNGADFGATESIRLLADDPETRVIAVYLESANDESLREALEYASSRKPVIVWPVGTTREAAAAAIFHTGSPGGGLVISAVPKTCFVVDRLEDLVDLPAALLASPSWPQNPHLAFASISGGFGVAFTALAARERMSMPILEASTQEVLSALYGSSAGNLTNPVDLGGPGFLSRGRLAPLLCALASDAQVNVVVFHLGWDYVEEVEGRVAGYGQEYLSALVAAIRQCHVPVIVYLPTLQLSESEAEARAVLRNAGCLVLEDLESIVRLVNLAAPT